MTRAASFVSAALALLLAAASARAADVVNASFEDPGAAPAGWTVDVGAQNGEGAESAVVIDRDVARDGKASLRMSGDAATRVWRMAAQSVPVKPGDRVVLRIAARCRGLRREGNQYENANGVLIFQGAGGRRLGIVGTAILRDDRDWVDLVAHALAPEGAVAVQVGFFSSMTGTVWFDHVRVEVTPTVPLDDRARATAYDELCAHLVRTYSFWQLEGMPPPGELFARHRAAAVAAADPAAFVEVVRAMLAELRDLHVWIQTPTGIVGTVPPGDPAPWNLAAVTKRLSGEPLVRGRNVLAGRIGTGDDAVGCLLVASLRLDAADLKKLDEAMDAFADVRALVIDVRPNGGGDERVGQRIASRLTAEPVLYARSVWRDPTLAGTDGFLPPMDRILEPATPGSAWTRPVVVLAGRGCISSTEGFLLMMRALPQVRIVGEPSRGASGNPGPFELLPGVTVFASRWRTLTPDGKPLERVGVEPHVRVEVPADAPADADPVLDRALELLRR